MGVWRNLKSWVKRTVIRVVLRVMRTKLVRFARKIARIVALPLTITAGGVAAGAGVAYLAGVSLVSGALIGAAAGIAGTVAWKMYLKYQADMRARQRLKINYTVWSKKEKSSTGRTYRVEASTSARRF